MPLLARSALMVLALARSASVITALARQRVDARESFSQSYQCTVGFDNAPSAATLRAQSALAVLALARSASVTIALARQRVDARESFSKGYQFQDG